MTYEEVLDDFPYLTKEDILASIAFVADRKRRFALVPLSAVSWTDEATEVVDDPGAATPGEVAFRPELSPALRDRLQGLYPGSIYVIDVGLDQTPDTTIWQYAKGNGFAVVSKDSDYRRLSYERDNLPSSSEFAPAMLRLHGRIPAPRQLRRDRSLRPRPRPGYHRVALTPRPPLLRRRPAVYHQLRAGHEG